MPIGMSGVVNYANVTSGAATGVIAQGYLANAGVVVLYSSASLSFNFSTTPSISTSLTFTRSSTATVIDFEGLVKTAKVNEIRFPGYRRVENIIPGSENSTNWTPANAGTGSGAAVSVVANSSPNGDSSFRIQATRGAGTTGSDSSYVRLVGQIGGGALARNSLWIKSNTGSSQNVQTTSTSNPVGQVIVATTAWQRLSPPMTAGDFVVGVRGTNGDANIDVLIWHPQQENVTGQANQNPSEYVSVGVLAYPYQGSGVDGVQNFSYQNGNTVNSNIVTQATGTAITDGSILLEEARTNLCLQSEVFKTTWVSSNVTITDNSIAAPDGNTTADTLTAAAGNATLLQTITSASADRTFSIWLKRKTGTGNIDLTVDNGATWTTQILTSAWVRFTLTQSAVTNPVIGVRIVTNADAVYAWGAQLGSYLTTSSYIPTTTTALTRSTDVPSFTGAGLSWYNAQQGTFVITASGNSFKAPSEFGAISLTNVTQKTYVVTYNNAAKSGSTYLYTAVGGSTPTEFTGVSVPTTVYMFAAGLMNVTNFTYYPAAWSVAQIVAVLT